MIHTFDSKSVRELRRDHQQLRDLMQRRERSATRENTDWGRLVRTGITTVNQAYPAYPGPGQGNVFVVAFESWTFDETPGLKAVTYQPSTQYVLARTEDGQYVPRDTHVTIYRHQARPGRRWWIRQSIPARLKAVVESPAGIARGGSGQARIWQAGNATNRVETVHLNWLAKSTDRVSYGKEIIIQWYQDELKWVIELAQCE